MTQITEKNIEEIMSSIRKLMEAEKENSEKENDRSSSKAPFFKTDLKGERASAGRTSGRPSGPQDGSDEVLVLTKKVPPMEGQPRNPSKEKSPLRAPHEQPDPASPSPSHSPSLDSDLLDRMVVEHIKPLIHEYVQKHLPFLIEKMVRDEMIGFLQSNFSKSSDDRGAR